MRWNRSWFGQRRFIGSIAVHKSLEQIENSAWPEPEGATSMMTRCLQLRKIPLSELTPSDLRLLISQKIGLTHVLPLALETLQLDPLIETDYYRGDLLSEVLNLPNDIWDEDPTLNNMMVEVKDELSIMLETVKDELLPKLSTFEYKS